MSPLFDYSKSLQSIDVLSDRLFGVSSMRYFHYLSLTICLATLILLILFQPANWQVDVLTQISFITLYILNLLAISIHHSVQYGKFGLITVTLLVMWLASIAAPSYPVSHLLWIPLIVICSSLFSGYKLGLYVSLSSVAGIALFNKWTFNSFSSFTSSNGSLITINAENFFFSFILLIFVTFCLSAFLIHHLRRNIQKAINMERMRMFYIRDTSMAIVSCNRQNEIISWNPVATKTFGYTEKEVLGKNCIDLLLATELERHKARKVFRQQKNDQAAHISGVSQVLAKDGHLISCEWFQTVIRDEKGKIIEFLCQGTDISERIAHEAVLETAKKQAEVATQAKSSFLANMSHEIRTPMNGVIGMTTLLAATDIDAEQAEFIDTIRKSSNALLIIINEILDFSKIEAEQVQLEENEFIIRACVEDAIGVFRSTVNAKEVQLKVNVDRAVALTAVGDVGRLRQVLVNLIGNALKFTPTGSVIIMVQNTQPDIELGDAIQLHFSVQDTGIGIDAAQIDGVFESFNQADISVTRKYGGTGLGLSISKQIVELMGGEIWVTSELGQGSTFHFTVLLQSVATSQFSRADHHHTGHRRDISEPFNTQSFSASDYQLSILLVEDNVVNQKVALHLLEKLGYKADIASNGLEAIAGIRRQPYDLILMDLQMPVMGGLEATRQIRATVPQARQPRIVAMTASVSMADQQSTKESGMDGFIGKPIQLEQLMEELRVSGNQIDDASTFMLSKVIDEKE